MVFEAAQVLNVFMNGCDLVVRHIEICDIKIVFDVFGNIPDEVVLNIQDLYVTLLICLRKVL